MCSHSILLLPGLDPVLDSIDDSFKESVDDSIDGERRPHLVAACALAQGSGIARPTRFRWGLIFRVWCQQGLLYRSDVFAAKRFDCHYPVQADHKFNMELVSNPRTVVAYRDDVICHFSSGGLSSTYRDSFRNDMPGIVRVCYGPFFWLLALIQYGLMISQHLDFSLHRYFGDLKYACSDESGGNHSRPISYAPLSSWTPLFRNDSTNSVMVLRKKMVAYDTSLRQGEDFECYMELLSKPDVRALYINRVLAGGFKSTLGVSGLSGNVKAMHAGRMLALRKLINRGNIGRAQYVFGISTEMVKYPLRFLRTWFNRRTGPFRLAGAKGSKANYGKQPGSAHADP